MVPLFAFIEDDRKAIALRKAVYVSNGCFREVRQAASGRCTTSTEIHEEQKKRATAATVARFSVGCRQRREASRLTTDTSASTSSHVL